MRKIQSRDLYELMQTGALDRDETHWAYNALDSAVTLRVHLALAPKIAASPHATTSYRFVRAMQGPAMAMMNRGVAIQQKVRQDETQRYLAIREAAQARLDALANAVWGPEEYTEILKSTEIIAPISPKTGKTLSPRAVTTRTPVARTRPRGLNPNSPVQVLSFFNIALGCPVLHEIRKTPHGTERTPTANDKALRKWAQRRTKGPGVDVRDRREHPVRIAAPFVSLILTIRDADKMLAVLKTPLDPDGRMRCSYNVVGTENGRWSSSKNAFGRGSNLQNITPSMRRMFCADDGYRMVSTDLEQAESRLVAGLVWQSTGDRAYWDACLSGDLHTTVCRMAWPELDWSSNDWKHNRAVADSPCADHPVYTYREVAKRVGHGSNYRGSAFGIAAAVGIPANVVEGFQHRYFRAFPGIPTWHGHTRDSLRHDLYLDTPLSRRRHFFSRPTEDSTLREAIAFIPQSTIGELLNLIMWNCWARSLPGDPFGICTDQRPFLPLQLLLQNHDAFLFQTPEAADLPWIIREVNAEFNRATVPLVRGDQHEALAIPGEFVTGWNWAYADKGSDPGQWTFADGNLDGLRKWDGRGDDRRRRQSAATTPADWLSHRVAPYR